LLAPSQAPSLISITAAREEQSVQVRRCPSVTARAASEAGRCRVVAVAAPRPVLHGRGWFFRGFRCRELARAPLPRRRCSERPSPFTLAHPGPVQSARLVPGLL